MIGLLPFCRSNQAQLIRSCSAATANELLPTPTTPYLLLFFFPSSQLPIAFSHRLKLQFIPIFLFSFLFIFFFFFFFYYFLHLYIYPTPFTVLIKSIRRNIGKNFTIRSQQLFPNDWISNGTDWRSISHHFPLNLTITEIDWNYWNATLCRESLKLKTIIKLNHI